MGEKAHNMTHIDYYFATISPFTYLAGTRLEEVAARHGATISYKPLDAPALFPRTGGQAFKDRPQSRKDYRAQDLRRQAAKLRLPLKPQPMYWPTNPAPSSYAIIAAQAAPRQGGGDLGGLVHAFGRACWAEDRNIAEDDVVRAILEANGFDAALAGSGLLLAAETYAGNLEQAVGRGVFGVPFYITDADERFWGQDRLDDLDRHLAGTI